MKRNMPSRGRAAWGLWCAVLLAVLHAVPAAADGGKKPTSPSFIAPGLPSASIRPGVTTASFFKAKIYLYCKVLKLQELEEHEPSALQESGVDSLQEQSELRDACGDVHIAGRQSEWERALQNAIRILWRKLKKLSPDDSDLPAENSLALGGASETYTGGYHLGSVPVQFTHNFSSYDDKQHKEFQSLIVSSQLYSRLEVPGAPASSGLGDVWLVGYAYRTSDDLDIEHGCGAHWPSLQADKSCAVAEQLVKTKLSDAKQPATIPDPWGAGPWALGFKIPTNSGLGTDYASALVEWQARYPDLWNTTGTVRVREILNTTSSFNGGRGMLMLEMRDTLVGYPVDAMRPVALTWGVTYSQPSSARYDAALNLAVQARVNTCDSMILSGLWGYTPGFHHWGVGLSYVWHFIDKVQ